MMRKTGYLEGLHWLCLTAEDWMLKQLESGMLTRHPAEEWRRLSNADRLKHALLLFDDLPPPGVEDMPEWTGELLDVLTWYEPSHCLECCTPGAKVFAKCTCCEEWTPDIQTRDLQVNPDIENHAKVWHICKFCMASGDVHDLDFTECTGCYYPYEWDHLIPWQDGTYCPACAKELPKCIECETPVYELDEGCYSECEDANEWIVCDECVLVHAESCDHCSAYAEQLIDNHKDQLSLEFK